VVSEWSSPPDLDAALDYYGQLVDQVKGRIQKAEEQRATDLGEHCRRRGEGQTGT
jgi:hypothetical protein